VDPVPPPQSTDNASNSTDEIINNLMEEDLDDGEGESDEDIDSDEGIETETENDSDDKPNINPMFDQMIEQVSQSVSMETSPPSLNPETSDDGDVTPSQIKEIPLDQNYLKDDTEPSIIISTSSQLSPEEEQSYQRFSAYLKKIGK
jgi:hypothetical protein